MPSDQAQEAFDAALNAHDGGDVAGAEARYREALAADPSMTVAHNNLGMVLIQQERLEEAVAALQQAVAIDPQYAEAYNNLGFAFRRLGRDVEAAEQYERFLGLTPDVEDAAKIRDWIGKVRVEAADAQEASAEADLPAQEPVAGQPASDSPFNLINQEGVASAAAEAAAPGAESPYGTAPAGETADAAADAPPADQEFAEFFESAPGDAGAAVSAGEESVSGASSGGGQDEEAVAAAGAGDSGLSDKAEQEFADMFGGSGLDGGQEAATADAGGDEDEEIGRLYTEAMTKFQDGDMGEAARFCSLVMEKSPQHFATLLLAGRVALSRQDHSRATALLQKAQELRNDDPEVYYFLGQCYEKRGLLDEAQEVYRKCLEVSPDGPRAKRLASWLEKQRSDSAVAEGMVRCELCLRTVSEEEMSAHEGRRVCRNCLDTLGAREDSASTRPRDEEEDKKSEKRVVPVPRRKGSPVLILLFLFVLLGAGGYVGAIYADLIPGPGFINDLLGKTPPKPKPVKVIKRPKNGKGTAKVVKVSPTRMEFAPMVVPPVQPLETLELKMAAGLKMTWPGNRTTPPKNSEQLSFSLEQPFPKGMTIEEDSGLLRWVPGGADELAVPGEQTARVVANCGKRKARKDLRLRVRYSLDTPREINVQLNDIYRTSRDQVHLAFADFDGDGRPDLAAACGRPLTGKLAMMLSAGGGSHFSQAPNWVLDSAPAGMAVGDLDGDRRTDLVWAEWMSGRLLLLRGAAGRAPSKAVRVAEARTVVDDLVLADLDGNGRDDAVVASRRAGKILVFKGRGGKLAETPLARSGLPPKLFVLDAGEGKADRVGLAVSGGTGAGKLLVYALRGGKLVRELMLELPKGVLECVRGGDVDGDGRPDVALLYGGRRGVLAVVKGAEGGKMSLLEPVPVGDLPLGIEIGEINGDGKADLVVSSPEEMRVFLSVGRGKFLKVGAIRVLGSASPVALWPARDGKPARAAVLNLKGRAWLLTLPAPLRGKAGTASPDAGDTEKGGGS